MKFVIDARTFDTATSTQAAMWLGAYVPDKYDDDDQGDHFGAEQIRCKQILYRTAKGNFFLHSRKVIRYPDGKLVVKDSAKHLMSDECADWIGKRGAAVIDDTGLPLPEEA